MLATNAHTPSLGYLKYRVMPVAVSALVTEPLTKQQRERLGWPGGEGMYTAHQILENLRLTPDNRVLIGSKRARLGFGNYAVHANGPGTFQALINVLRERFPELHDVAVDTGWTGTIAVTGDFVPIIGCTGRSRNIYYSLGYGGHGIAMASHAGFLLGKLMHDGDLGEANVLLKRRFIPIPPEPFRWMIGQAQFAIMRLTDDVVDRKSRRANQPGRP